MLKSFKSNVRLFPEGDTAGTIPATTTPTTPPVTPEPAKPQGKTFSEDYVTTLRNESAGYRSKAKGYEAALRKVLNIADSEELGNLDERIANATKAQQTALDNAMKTANDRLIVAEINSLEGYDTKLLAKIIDRSKIKISDDGKIEGLEEAAKAAAEEFPAVKSADNPPPYAAGTGNSTLNTKNSPEDNALRAAFGLKTE